MEKGGYIMIKVVHFLPSINVTSGIVQMIMNYYRVIDTTQIQFDFIYFIPKSKVNFEKEIIKLGGKITFVSDPSRYFKFYKEVGKCLGEYDSERIIFHNHQIPFTVLLQPILKKYGIKDIIVHNHMTQYSDKLISSIRNKILCYPIRFLNVKYFACSKEAGEFMFGKKRVQEGLVTIMNNGIDCEKYLFDYDKRKNIRIELGLEHKFVIGHIGHFNKVKNHRLIIDCFEKVYLQNQEARLLLIATGPLRKDVERWIKEKNLIHNVIILENRNDIPQLMWAMDVFIFPSLFEGLGIAAIEAQATGLPVFISDRIPSCVKIYNCEVISLESGSDRWAKEVNKVDINIENREKGYFEVKNSEYNILYQEKKYLEYIKNLQCLMKRG